jgi:hypothetical protein
VPTLTNCYCYILYDQVLKKKIEQEEDFKDDNNVMENFFDPETSVSQIDIKEDGNQEEYKE